VGNTDVKMTGKSYNQSILTELPLIYREQGSGTRFVMEEFIEKKKLTIRKKFELTSNEAVKQAVIAGLGYSIMPLIGIHNELITDSVQIIPVEGLPLKSKWSLIWLKNKKMSPVAEAFLNEIKLNKKKIIEKSFIWLNDFDKY
jgi:DNA-binding transcriptional LysR family regulator